MALSRKYYRMIAKCIKSNSVEVVDETTQDGEVKAYINKDNLLNDLCLEFKLDNIYFNYDRFVDACND